MKIQLGKIDQELFEMICPGCGLENPEESRICSGCGYKFAYLHAHGDPSKMQFFDFSRLRTRGQKCIYIFIFSLAIILLLLAIIRSFKLH